MSLLLHSFSFIYAMWCKKRVRISYFHSETKSYSVECLCYCWLFCLFSFTCSSWTRSLTKFGHVKKTTPSNHHDWRLWLTCNIFSSNRSLLIAHCMSSYVLCTRATIHLKLPIKQCSIGTRNNTFAYQSSTTTSAPYPDSRVSGERPSSSFFFRFCVPVWFSSLEFVLMYRCRARK